MCRVLAVSANGYYAWRQRPPSARARADAELTARITAIHQYSRATYGAPRIHEELLAAGLHVGLSGSRVDEGRRPVWSEPPQMGNYHGARALARGRHPTWSNATLSPRRPIGCGSPTISAP